MSSTTSPSYATAAIVAEQVRLRIYRGSTLEVDMPMRRRQALVLGAQLINLGLLPEYAASADPLVFETPIEGRVAAEDLDEHGR